MRWGRRWGTLKTEKGGRFPTLWGAEGGKANVRIDVRLIKDQIVPCNICGNKPTCAKYHNFTRKMLRHGEYNQGTNRLDQCDIFISNKAPHDYIRKTPISKTSGKEPT